MFKKLFMILLSCTILFSACSSDKAETSAKAVKEKTYSSTGWRT